SSSCLTLPPGPSSVTRTSGEASPAGRGRETGERSIIRLKSLHAVELRVAEAPARLAIHGLGSCVAVFVYDPGNRVGGMAHVLLPGPPRHPTDHVGRYATTAVAAMVTESIRLGANPSALLAKVTGGSRMVAFDVGKDRPTLGDQ